MRKAVTKEQIDKTVKKILEKLKYTLHKKGPLALVSRHEILGVLEEEIHELKSTCSENLLENFEHELMDVVIAAIFGLICLQGDHLEW